MIKLGDRVKDKYTGFEGIAIARTEWLYGCTRITIESTTLHEGKTIDPHSFDEQRVIRVEEAQPFVSPQSEARTGGPYPDPARPSI